MCEEPGTGRRRWELFKELPDKRVRDYFIVINSFSGPNERMQEYPDYYQTIAQPIAMSHLRKRAQTNYYRDVQHYRDEWRLMFNNARTYNQEGSWVYVDAEEMEKVFNEVFDRLTVGTDLPGAEPARAKATAPASSSQIDEDEKPISRRNSGRNGSKQILSDDDEYLTPSEDD